MKRKIAVLLSAMMVASAMPMTASAVELKSDSVVNAGFGKVGSTIDAKAGGYKDYTTASELKNRESVLKLTLENPETGDIEKGNGSFKVTLTNGTFGDLSSGNANSSAFGYKNVDTKGFDVVYTDTAGKYYLSRQNLLAASTDGTGSAISIPEGAIKISGGKVQGVVNNGKLEPIKDTAVVDALNSVLEKFKGMQSGADTATNGKLNTFAKAEKMQAILASTGGWVSVKEESKKLLTTLKNHYAELSAATKVLPHIPYDVEILSPTEARITPKNTISDKMVDSDLSKKPISTVKFNSTRMSFETAQKLGMEVFKIDESDSSKIKLAADGSEVAKLAKGIDEGFKEGYITLCPKTASKKPWDSSEGVIEKDDVKTITVDGKPYMALPLGGVKVSGDGAVKAKVEADYSTKVKGGEYTITKGTGEGSTTLVYPTSSVKSFDESLTLDQVTIRENARGTIANGASTATFTLKVNSGFKFDNTVSGSSLTGLQVVDASARNTVVVDSAKYVGDGQSTIEVKVSGLTNRDNVIGLSVKGLKVAPVNSKNFGDVELTVSGNGIDSKTVKVAKREAIGFKLETAKQAKEIVAGRSYEKDTVNMNLQDSQTVEVKFSELVSGSLISSRSLDFNLPEGVKIVDAELSEIRNMNNLAKDDFEIINNGKTLRLKPNGYTVNSNAGKNLASFKLKFELSVAPDFAGDIKCTVTGGGQGSDAKVETVIAKAIAPFKIETKNTKINLGYQDYNTADIVITEAKPGMFLQNKEVVIGLKAPFKGGNTIGFSQASYEVSGGELEVKDKDFKVENDVIKFKVNRNSTKNPSTITIKNVKIGTNRSVPFGSYNLTVAGDAVLNNYSATKDKNGNVQVSNDDKNYNLSSLTSTDKKQLANQDRTEYFEIKDYVNVVTETGTFNETVKVSVGEKTVVVGGQTLDMDVAPYIQASSNSTMVPLRFVAVALGVDSANVANPDQSSKVAWDQNSKTVTIYYGAGTGQKIIQFQAGSNVMTVDGTRIPMEYGVKAEIKEGRMFVPFRALGQALGVSVSWDPETRTAIYNAENARNANVTTTTTKETTTATTTATTTTKKEDSTTSTTKAESTTETTTAAKK